LTQHIMGQLNRLGNNNETVVETLTNSKFVTSTVMIILQIVLVGLVTAVTNPLNKIIGKFINNMFYYFRFFVFSPIFKIYAFLVKIITRTKILHTISRDVPLFTTNYKRNNELFNCVQWYLTRIDLNQEIDKDNIKENFKEVYYDSEGTPLIEFTQDANNKINFNLLPKTGYSNSCVQYLDHKIYFDIEKSIFELNTEIESTKRDNIIIHLTTKHSNFDSNILEKFIEHCVMTYNENKTEWNQKIFHNAGSDWKSPINASSPKSADSIILKDGMKEQVIRSINFFVNNKDFYLNHSIRWKYTVLIMGQPGTGKTSFVSAWAREHKYNIYNLSYKGSNEGDLQPLVENIETTGFNKGILLIDDFDHVFTMINEKPTDTHNQSSQSEDEEDRERDRDKSKRLRRTKIKKNNISYTELLSVLDGVNSKEGLLIFICVNDPSKLFANFNTQNTALIRDRRFNLTVSFDLCDHSMIKRMYESIFKIPAPMDIINLIPEEVYAPCVISQQFISFYEKYGGFVKDHMDELHVILKDFTTDSVKSNEYYIIEFMKSLNKTNIQRNEKLKLN
jgi:AAA+ superfamily predicted ATPase